jgi:glutamate decarboxylase
VPYIRAADEAAASRANGQPQASAQNPAARNVLLEKVHRPAGLAREMKTTLPTGEGRGKDGVLETIQDVLKYSVNTWDQGFLDKLYASTTPVSENLCHCFTPVLIRCT